MWNWRAAGVQSQGGGLAQPVCQKRQQDVRQTLTRPSDAAVQPVLHYSHQVCEFMLLSIASFSADINTCLYQMR